MILIRRYFQNISHYDVLGVKPNCSQEEIKVAFYNKAKLYHPDVQNGNQDDAKYKSISLAYDILSNELNRKDYDLKHNFNTVKSPEITCDESEYFWSRSAQVFRQRNSFFKSMKHKEDHEPFQTRYQTPTSTKGLDDKTSEKTIVDDYVPGNSVKQKYDYTSTEDYLLTKLIICSLLVYFGVSILRVN